MDLGLVLGGLAVGVVVGMTGMGGGALMTPMLVFLFGVNPLAAVSSDLVTTAVMKPFGGAVHAARRTVEWRLVGWLALGAVPSGFAGVFVLRALGGADVVEVVSVALGVALALAVLAIVVRAYLGMGRQARDAAAAVPADTSAEGPIEVRPLPTVAVGVVGGLVVGMTSVGSGSLMIIALMALYPRLAMARLVGTDLVQAVPLVAAAALGHLFFGDVQLGITASLLAGSIPGTLIGALVSTRAPAALIRGALAFVLLASALKLLGVPTPVVVAAIAACAVIGPLAWMAARVRHGLSVAPAAARIRLRPR